MFFLSSCRNMQSLTSKPMDRMNASHPSIFQSPQYWNTPGHGVQSVPSQPQSQGKVRDLARVSIGQEIASVLSTAFIGSANLDIVQKGLQQGVYAETGHVIGRQSEPELLNVMTLVYNAHARNVVEENYAWDALKAYVINEVKRLNCLVYTEVIPVIVANVQHYLRYIQDKNNPLPVAPTPIYTGSHDYTLVNPVDAAVTLR